MDRPVETLPEEAARLVAAGEQRGLTLRVMGGVAVALACPSARRPPLARDYGDIDLAGVGSQRGAIEELLGANGYVGDRETNLLHGRQRLIFWDPDHARQLDVMFDRLVMCHEIEFDGLADSTPTLPLADLLMTKLQVYETTDKDFRDIVALLLDHPLAGAGSEVSLARIEQLTRGDWGLWRTATEVLEHTRVFANSLALAPGAKEFVSGQIGVLLAVLEEAPKTRRWRMRAKVGDRVQWYELPEAAKASAAG